jgi:C-22 sterol desaturase
VPAGSMLIPSFYNSLHDPVVYPEPDAFLPKRWLDPASLANANPKNYMVWGAGPHRCIGLEYAMMNIGLVLATAAMMFDWEHEITPKTDKIECVLFFCLVACSSTDDSAASLRRSSRKTGAG